MAGGVPDWDQTGKQELPDVTTTQSQGSYGQDGCAGTDMPAARRAEMQAECGQTLLRRIWQNKTGENDTFKVAAIQVIFISRASITQPHPQGLGEALLHLSGVSKHTKVGHVLCVCLRSSCWDLSMSGAINDGCVMGPFCLDEKHHWDLNEAPREVQERASWYNKGKVLLVSQ